MYSWIKKWSDDHRHSFLERVSFVSTSIEEIHSFVYEKMNVILNPVVSERITKPGFYMNLHRDDYHLDYYKFKKGVRDNSLWVPIYNIEKRPVVTVLWYQSTQGIDFIGGNLRFHDGYTVKPAKNSAIMFDSNDPHEITLQTLKYGIPNERKVIIIKYYKDKLDN